MILGKLESANLFLEVIAGIDKEKLNISNDEEVVHVMEIMMAVTFQNLMKQFARQSTFEDALNKYLFEINLLKKGLYKGSE